MAAGGRARRGGRRAADALGSGRIEDACARLARAWAAHLEDRPDAAALIREVDHVMTDASRADDLSSPMNLALARLLEDIGDLEAAYHAARRQVMLPGGDRYMATLLREEGRLAARLGMHEEARRTYARFLDFFSDPDPGPARDAADAVRRELASLQEAGARR